MTSALVNAKEQAVLAEKAFGRFDRNGAFRLSSRAQRQISSQSKNQTGADYRKATGLEAVWGYLYLTGKFERLAQLLEVQNENRG